MDFSIKRAYLGHVIKEVLDHGISKAQVRGAFKKSGVYPFDPLAVDRTHVVPIPKKPVTREESSDSEEVS